jgi:hypothetical protein
VVFVLILKPKQGIKFRISNEKIKTKDSGGWGRKVLLFVTVTREEKRRSFNYTSDSWEYSIG